MTSGTMLARGRRGEEGSSGGQGVDVDKMESIGPTTILLYRQLFINHNPDLLVGIDCNLDVCRGFE